ncbi:MAG: hypothetical protein AAB217_16385 [Chloroflexota bacterium]
MNLFPSSHVRELELLSAYLDNQLTPAERAKLERRLAQEPQLQATLDDLRTVKVRLVALPKVKPPRNFTLTLKQLEAHGLATPARPPARLFPLVNLATALAAVLFAVLITADLGGSFNLATPAQAPAAQVESFQVAGAPAEAQAVESASADTALKSTTETPEAGVSMLAPPVEAEPLTSAPGEGGGGGGGVGTTNTGPATDAGGGALAGVTGTVEPTVAPPETVAQAAITETPTPDSSRTRVTTEVPLVTQEATETPAQTPPVVRVAEIALGLVVILLVTASLFLRRR